MEITIMEELYQTPFRVAFGCSNCSYIQLGGNANVYAYTPYKTNLLNLNHGKNSKNRLTKISQAGLETRARNYTSKLNQNLQNKSFEKIIGESLKYKVKSKRWAKRHNDFRYTN